MTPNRRNFIIGTAGVSTTLALPIVAQARQSVDPLGEDFARYFAFLSHEHKQAWIDIQTAKYVERYGFEEARRITVEQVENGCWPMAWQPDDHADVTRLCANSHERPKDRAMRVLRATRLS
ncbi:MAG: hypothetical protein WBA35_00165 [Litorimonas sp.]